MRLIRHITIPCIKNVIVIMLILAIGGIRAVEVIEASDPVYGKEIAAMKKLAMKDGYRDYNRNPAFDVPIVSSTKYQTNQTTLYLNGLAKIIMAKQLEFDRVLASVRADYLKNGGQEIIDEKTKAYDAMHK